LARLLQLSPRSESLYLPTWALMFRKTGEAMKGKKKRTDQRAGETRQNRQNVAGLPTVRTNVAGMDLGSEEHWVCAPALDGAGREIASFGGTTGELLRLAGWLKERQVESVAMESTGVYWIAPHEVLEGQGLPVLLVDTRRLAEVPGRDKKSDPSDCEWIQHLHSCGLLRGAFRPREEVCMLRTMVRDKANLVAESGDWVRRMQKSLDQMNVRLHRAVSDIDGATGMAILRAIVNGERNPEKLAELRDPRCRSSQEEIAEQLRGHWREDHLFSLKQALTMYDAVQERIGAYDEEILRRLGTMERDAVRGTAVPPVKNPSKAKSIRRRGEEPMREALYRMSGVDLTSIDALGVETVQVVLSEYGADLSGFDTEGHFVSHLRLTPHKPTSAGKPLKKKRRNSASTRVAAALRMAATSMRNSQTALGAYYRHIAQRIGGDVAVFATARKLAILIYRLLRWGTAYVDEGAEAYERRCQQNRLQALKSRAKQLGYELVQTA